MGAGASVAAHIGTHEVSSVATQCSESVLEPSVSIIGIQGLSPLPTKAALKALDAANTEKISIIPVAFRTASPITVVINQHIPR